MLIDFTFDNYLSFGEDNNFSMVATAEKSNLQDNTFLSNELRILKSAAVYGANGSGKSNFVDAFAYMRSLLLEHSKPRKCSFVLNKNKVDSPSFFEVIFQTNDGNLYRYGFEVEYTKFVSEWLYTKSSSKETRLFTRSLQDIDVNRVFKEGRSFTDNVKENRLFLSVVAELNGVTSNSIKNWFKDIRIMSGLDMSHHDTLYLLERNKNYKDKVLKILHSFDVQMEGFTVKPRKRQKLPIPDGSNVSANLKTAFQALDEYLNEEGMEPMPIVITHRAVYKGEKNSNELEDFDLLENESAGTQKLFAIAGLIVEALENGLTLFVDELESKLHPLITKTIVNMFNSSAENKKNAQLIFTTHDTNLLNGGHLRRDQIWFTEKDKYGSTHLYSLAEYKSELGRDNLENDYIHGRFGAIPFIGSMRI